MDLLSKLKEASARNKEILAKGGTASRLNFLTLANGESKVVRMLPMGAEGELLYPFKEYRMHTLKIKDGFRTFICAKDPANGGDRFCPLCELQKALWFQAVDFEEEGSPESLELAEIIKKKAINLRSKDRIAVNTIVKDAESDKVYQIFDMSRTTFNMVMGLIESDGYGVITDIEEGSDLTVTRQGERIDTKYMVVPRKKNDIVIPEDWYKYTINLNNLRKVDEATLVYLADVIASGKEIHEIEQKDIPFSNRPTTYTVKVEPEEEVKVEPKVEPEEEVKVEPKVEVKEEVKVEPKVEPKVEVKEEVKVEPKVEPKVEVKEEVKVEPRSGTDIAQSVQAQVQATLERLRAAKAEKSTS